MSRELLINLRDYLVKTLSEDDKIWLALQLQESASEDPVEPYTVEELRLRAEKSRQDALEGRVFATEEVLRMCDEELQAIAV